LQEQGWVVSGNDLVPAVSNEALERGIISGQESDGSRLIIIATPASAVQRVAESVLSHSSEPELIVTDVAGVKDHIATSIIDPRFIGGHPMAGSEKRGFDGASAHIFRGCTWVLTPTETTSATTYSALHSVLRDIGAMVVAISPGDHDRLVALASHVPHIVAGALMNEASDTAQHDAVLLKLAAGGFRDMTRVAAGDPSIWPDILFENSVAVTEGLRHVEERLAGIRRALLDGDRSKVSLALATASAARRELPGRALNSSELAYLRVVIADQPGSLAQITTIASELLINIFDIEIAHDVSSPRGALLMTVDHDDSERFLTALNKRGFLAGHA
jgi:prephenate dehydrogenase